jgi:WhiB family redox-sensing transcriptional regulator
MTVSDNRAGWWSAAACLTADPELFFPISSAGLALEQVTQAKAICARCGIQQACLGYALDGGRVQGIWGGTTEGERRRLRRRLRQERAGPAQEQAVGPAVVQQGLSS